MLIIDESTSLGVSGFPPRPPQDITGHYVHCLQLLPSARSYAVPFLYWLPSPHRSSAVIDVMMRAWWDHVPERWAPSRCGKLDALIVVPVEDSWYMLGRCIDQSGSTVMIGALVYVVY